MKEYFKLPQDRVASPLFNFWPFNINTSKGGEVPKVTALGVAVKYSEETAEVNPQMIVNEFKRIIEEINHDIRDASYTANQDLKITSGKFTNNYDENMRGVTSINIKMEYLINNILCSDLNKDAKMIHEDIFKFIDKYKETQKIVTDLEEKRDNAKKEMAIFESKYL
jgi:hypothetical protein